MKGRRRHQAGGRGRSHRAAVSLIRDNQLDLLCDGLPADGVNEAADKPPRAKSAGPNGSPEASGASLRQANGGSVDTSDA